MLAYMIRSYKTLKKRSCTSIQNLLLVITFCSMTTSLHVGASDTFAFTSNPSSYVKIPDYLQLKKVILVMRHGDRTQISRTLGQNYPESDEVASFWKKTLPIHETILKLRSAASLEHEHLTYEETGINEDDDIYAGWDHINVPYGMLTEVGSQQLINLGYSLRSRYATFINQNQEDNIYCRSTNMCRTLLSLRSLLYGLFSPSTTITSSSASSSSASSSSNTINGKQTMSKLPIIASRPKPRETLFPQADGPCPALSDRREHLFGPNYLSRMIPNYDAFETKIKTILGYDNIPVPWLIVKEVITCYFVHGYPLPTGLSQEDVEKATFITGYLWGALYNDKILNRLAIGRFVQELLEDIHVIDDNNDNTATASTSSDDVSTTISTNSSSQDTIKNSNNISNINGYDYRKDSRQAIAPKANMLIYSGHDSTLVPLLCALGIYDDIWPPYASYLTIEIVEVITNQCSTNSDKENEVCTNIPTGNTDTPSPIHMNELPLHMRIPGSKWVRVIYNDKLQYILKHSQHSTMPTKSMQDLHMNHVQELRQYQDSLRKNDKNNDKNSENTENPLNTIWYSYSDFLQEMNSFTVTKDEYQIICQQSTALHTLKHDNIIKQMEDEIAATIGVVKSSQSSQSQSQSPPSFIPSRL